MSNAFLCCGILLAAGRGKRFDPTGQQHKLLQILSSGASVITTSAQHLQQALPVSIAVIAQATPAIGAALNALHVPTYLCLDADLGMAHSLRTGLQNLPDGVDGFIIALADMPFVSVQSIEAIRDRLSAGAEIVVPVYAGQRGNPVGFSKKYVDQLLTLEGDRGARQLLQNAPVTEIVLPDPGILQDIDRPEDVL